MLTFCSVEDFKLFLFHKNLVNSKTIRTIVQAAKNNINSRNVKNCDNQWRLKTFFKELSEILELDLSGILRAISTEAQLQGLNEKELPYLKEENMTQFSLQTGIHAFQPCLIDEINVKSSPLKICILESPNLSSHPVHLLGPRGKPMPSALIPFCSYGSDMEVVGKDFGNFSFPICDSFKATLHQGRVCYKLSLDPQLKSKDGMEGGLMLVVDTNPERSVELPDASPGSARIRKQVRFMKPVQKGSAEVYISTMAPLTFSQPGEYRLYSLKKMTGTESFTMLSHSVTKCSDRSFEECKDSRSMKSSLKECGCLPWALKGVTLQVNHKASKYIDALLRRAAPMDYYCGQCLLAFIDQFGGPRCYFGARNRFLDFVHEFMQKGFHVKGIVACGGPRDMFFLSFKMSILSKGRHQNF